MKESTGLVGPLSCEPYSPYSSRVCGFIGVILFFLMTFLISAVVLILNSAIRSLHYHRQKLSLLEMYEIKRVQLNKAKILNEQIDLKKSLLLNSVKEKIK